MTVSEALYSKRNVYALIAASSFAALLSAFVLAGRMTPAEMDAFRESVLKAELTILALLIVVPTLSGGGREDLPLAVPTRRLAKIGTLVAVAGVGSTAVLDAMADPAGYAGDVLVIWLFGLCLVVFVPILTLILSTRNEDDMRAVCLGARYALASLAPPLNPEKSRASLREGLGHIFQMLHSAVGEKDVLALESGLREVERLLFLVHESRWLPGVWKRDIHREILYHLEDLCETATGGSPFFVGARAVSDSSSRILRRCVGLVAGEVHGAIPNDDRKYAQIDVRGTVRSTGRILKAMRRTDFQSLEKDIVKTLQRVALDPCIGHGHLDQEIPGDCHEAMAPANRRRRAGGAPARPESERRRRKRVSHR